MELHVGIEPTSDAYKTTALTIELMERIYSMNPMYTQHPQSK